MRIRNSLLMMAILGLFGIVVCTDCRKSSPPKKDGSEGAPSKSDAPVLDEKIKKVFVELTARWDQLQAFSAALNTELSQAAGKPGKTKGKGTYAWAKRGDKRLIRIDLANSLLIHHGDAEGTQTGEILVFVYDGEFLYSQLQQPIDFKQTTKSRYEPHRILQVGGQELFSGLAEANTLKMNAEEFVDGRAAYVVEATPISGKGSSVYYFDKQTGAQLKLIVHDGTGKVTLTLTLSELNTAPEFGEDYFTYKLPDGFELIDKSQEEP